MTFWEILVFFFLVIFHLDPTQGLWLVEESLYFILKNPRSKNKPHPQITVTFNLSTWVVVFHIYQLFRYSFPLVFSRSEGKRKSTVLYAVLRTEHHILLLNNRWFRLQDITAKPFPSSLALCIPAEIISRKGLGIKCKCETWWWEAAYKAVRGSEKTKICSK